MRRLFYSFAFGTFFWWPLWSIVSQLPSPYTRYFAAGPMYGVVWASLALVGLTTLITWVVASLWPSRWEPAGMAIGAILIGVLSLRLPKPLIVEFGRPAAIVVLVVLVVWVTAAIHSSLNRSGVAGTVLKASMACAFGVFVVNSGSLLFQSIRSEETTPTETEPAAVSESARTPSRVVFLVFDEVDYRLAFDERPEAVQLPALDRLRSESLFAAAYPPGLNTLDAAPSYLTGQAYREVAAADASHLRLFPSPDGAPRILRAEETILGELHREGARIAVVGWYHPYCRLLAEATDYCYWAANPAGTGTSMVEEVVRQKGVWTAAARLVGRHFFVSWLPEAMETPLRRADVNVDLETVGYQYSIVFREVARESLAAVADPAYDFVFAHLPVPHPPAIEPGGEWTPAVKPSGIAYYDNLNLLDAVVGRLRTEMERRGVWDSTHVILTSDHHLRRTVWVQNPEWIGGVELLSDRERGRIPVFLKLAGQTDAATYDQPFNAILLHDLALALSRGEMHSSAEVRSWLSGNRSRFPLAWDVRVPSGEVFRANVTLGGE